MIFVTGDTHGDLLGRFDTLIFPQQITLTKKDFVIVCGDFGGLWKQKEDDFEKFQLDYLENKPFTTLFIDGNHENFNRLNNYPIKKWHNGAVHKIRPSVIHLMRGQVYTDICGKNIFTFGGARSHDISDGILEENDDRISRWIKAGKLFRIRNLTWWEEEYPNQKERDLGLKNLETVDFKVDYVFTHDIPSSWLNKINKDFKTDDFNDYLEFIKTHLNYNHWFAGHYHRNLNLTNKDSILFEDIKQI